MQIMCKGKVYYVYMRPDNVFNLGIGKENKTENENSGVAENY